MAPSNYSQQPEKYGCVFIVCFTVNSELNYSCTTVALYIQEDSARIPATSARFCPDETELKYLMVITTTTRGTFDTVQTVRM